MKLNALMDKQFRIVEKKKIFIISPIVILLVALIVGTIFAARGEGFFNLGFDFTGGYSMEVRLGTRLNEDNFEEYAEQIIEVVEQLSDTNGDNYGLRVGKYQLQGRNETSAILIRFSAVADESVMQEIINPALRDALQDKFFSGANIGTVSDGTSTSGSQSQEFLSKALLAVMISLFLMLIYIAFRFEMISGFSTIINLIHDILIMTCFMVIFRIEVTATFVAALITILSYSINNTIIIFDKIRETSKNKSIRKYAPSEIANDSVKSTLTRTAYTTFTTTITVFVLTIISLIVGLQSITIFTLPLIVGLLAGTYSTMFLVPSLWAMVRTNDLKRVSKGRQVKKKA